MRSDKLQEEHRSVYEKFYAQHDLVVSVPHVFRRGQSISRGKNTISIKQKLPTRMYAGVVPLREGGIKIRTISSYRANKNIFIEQPAKQVIKKVELWEDFLSDVLAKLNFKGGAEINILTEYERGNGMWFVGTFSAVLALIGGILSGKIDLADIPNEEHPVANAAFRFVIFLGIMMDAICNAKAPGFHSYVALSYNGDPILRLAKLSLDDIRNRVSRSSNLYAMYEEIEDQIEEKLVEQCLNLRDVVKLPKQANLTPFDFSILYLGLPFASSRNQSSYSGFEEQYNLVIAEMQQLQQRMGLGEITIPELDLHALSYYFASHLLQRRCKFIAQPYDNSLVDGFIHAINDNGMYHGLIERENHLLGEVQQVFRKSKTIESEQLGVIPVSTARAGGCLLCVTQFEESQETMSKLLDYLQKNGYPDAHFQYQSWRDGKQAVGAQVDQYLSKSHFSGFVKSGNVVVMHANGSSEIVDYSAARDLSYTGIMFDTVKRKLYLNGEKTNHKQLVSQSGTVELFECLLGRIGEYVRHTELPPSSYTRNKNEMLGKIIMPLQALVKEKFDTELPIECIGTTYDFEICLKSDGGLLHIIKRLSQI